MSWHFSRALVEAYSEEPSVDSGLYALLKMMPSAEGFSSHGKTISSLRGSRFGMTCERLTAFHGEVLLTWFLEVFLARTPQATDADKWNNMTAEERIAKGQFVRLPNELEAGGKQSPMWTEWFMGFPIGWTALEPLETHRYQEWCRSHGKL